MSFYEEVEIEDMTYLPATQEYTYPCPCGDVFAISLEELWDGEDVGLCASCTLRIKVVFEEGDLPELEELEEEEEEGEGAKEAGEGAAEAGEGAAEAVEGAAEAVAKLAV
jgi:diphthamide biosynthesis protein 3